MISTSQKLATAKIWRICQYCAVRATQALIIIVIVTGGVWLTHARADEIALGAGAGVLHSTDKTFSTITFSLPSYQDVLITYERWTDNSGVAINYRFMWPYVRFDLGAGVVANETGTIAQTGVAHFGIGIRPVKWLDIGVSHWSSPARDKGENAVMVQYVTKW
jgi:hypothetical protein